MGWFDEQIRQRKQHDQEVFEDSFVDLAGVVLGKKAAKELGDERLVTRAAIEEILKYYHYKSKEIPETVKDSDDQLEYLLRPHGIMRRNVVLEKGWYKDSFGPMLAFFKDDSQAAALIPKGLRGYYYTDFNTGKKITLNKKNAELFETDAICFYHPLPMKKLSIRDLFAYMAGSVNKSDYLLIVLATLAVTGLGLIITPLVRTLTGKVYIRGDKHILFAMAIFMICATISSQMISAVRNLINARISTKVTVSLEAATMMRTLSLPSRFFRKFSSGDLSIRVSSVSLICSILIGSVMLTGLTSLSSLLYIFQIFKYAKSLVLPAVAVILTTLVVSVIASLMQIRISRQHLELSAKEAGLSYALISGIQKIKLAGAEKRAFAKWSKAYAESAAYVYDPPTFLKVNNVLTAAAALIGNIVLYFAAARDGITTEDFFAFNAAFGMVTAAFAALAQIAVSIGQIPPILSLAKPILETEPETSEKKEMVTRLSGVIELNSVSFRYTENMPYVINELSLKIRAGEYVAIVGETGCGKSTLMRLLLGFEAPERGAVYYDGKDLNTLDLKSLRRHIGTVMQNGSLFQGDIYSNIVISAPDLPLDAAWEAAELAGIADDIKAMPMGMHTVISEGQGGISGGQKQRLMIARAVAPKPKILMFDEATSALDNMTQKHVSDSLDKLKCTRIVIAHRLSTIRNCSRIIYLDKGSIAEDGTYEELIEKNGKFAALVKRQMVD